jgi:hypothetical protein
MGFSSLAHLGQTDRRRWSSLGLHDRASKYILAVELKMKMMSVMIIDVKYNIFTPKSDLFFNIHIYK